MAVSVPRKSSQLPLFARAQCNPHWTNLSSDVKPKIVRLQLGRNPGISGSGGAPLDAGRGGLL
jgi:hypothetical protein